MAEHIVSFRTWGGELTLKCGVNVDINEGVAILSKFEKWAKKNRVDCRITGLTADGEFIIKVAGQVCFT